MEQAQAERRAERAIKQAEGVVEDAALLAAARKLLPELVEAEQQLLQRSREANQLAAAQMAAAAKAVVEAAASAAAPRPARSAGTVVELGGLTLQLSDNAAGYRGVFMSKSGNLFEAKVKRGGKKVRLGSYATAAEAAMAYARTPEAQDQVKGCFRGL